MKFKNYYEFIDEMENWMKTGGSFIPQPSVTPVWKKLDKKVTPETVELLKKLQPVFSEVAIFSWHPDIQKAQYSANPKYFHPTNGRIDNSNSRMHIWGSIIAKRSEDSPKGSTFETGDILSRSINSFPFMESQGGSGTTEDGRDVSQRQVSFLVNGVGTHEEAQKMQDEKMTSGAYKFENNEWKYILREEFSPLPKLEKDALDELEWIKDLIEHSPLVDTTRIDRSGYNKQEPKMFVECKHGKEIKKFDIKVFFNGEFNYSVSYSWDFGSRKDLVYALAEGINRRSGEVVVPPLFPGKGKELSEHPENIDKIMHDLRGLFHGKSFGI